jgi:hypothetical protein
MNRSEDQDNLIGSLIEKVEQYTRSTAELQKLKAIDKSADVLSTLVAYLMVIICFSIFYIILNIGIALVLGDLMGQLYLGFLVLAGFHAFVGLIIYLMRSKWIKQAAKEKIISQWID